MLAAVFNGKKNLVLSDYPLRKLNKNEILIRVAGCGVCGTDRHIYEGTAPSSTPVILGHEYSGTIVEKGDRDSKFNIGDNVAVDPNIYCGSCFYCRKGLVSFCENLNALGVTLNGGFAEYSIVPVSQAYLLPSDFDLSAAAFSEPLSCCLRGIEQADIKSGNTVIIIGGGSIGLLMVQLVKNTGASKVILIEPDQYKQDMGIQLGADYSFSPDDKNLIEKITDLSGSLADVVIECVGNNSAVSCAINMAGRGGKVVVFGLAPKDQTVAVNLQNLYRKELKILGSFLNPFTFRPAVDLLVNKKINVNILLTKQVLLKNISEIFLDNSSSGNIKVQIINN
jgi:2-desacetyl-2-hydroxyethyl bacteriochlorophyllide A dehydrogenase